MYLGSEQRRVYGLLLRKKDSAEFAKAFTKVGNRFRRAKTPEPLAVTWNAQRSLFAGANGTAKVHVGRRARLDMQIHGVRPRHKDLFGLYTLGIVPVGAGDVVLDWGGHIGEFSLACATLGAKAFAFEPDPVEFSAMSANAEGLEIIPINKALAAEDGNMRFYQANDTGDSSLIEPAAAHVVVDVQAVTLDAFLADHMPEGEIRALKLEAEGAEPEVLAGAGESLKRIRYICAAAGPERGTGKETTLAQITDTLYANGFRMRDFGTRYYVAVFENTQMALLSE